MKSNQLPDLLNSDLFKATIGFDNLFSALEKPIYKATGYPFYNIAVSRPSDDKPPVYEITMAVAGFTDEDIDIVLDRNVLKITGTSHVLDKGEDVQYLFQGISARNFERRFQVAEHVEVIDATLKHGMLTVTLQQNVPEELQPKRIDIKS